MTPPSLLPPLRAIIATAVMVVAIAIADPTPPPRASAAAGTCSAGTDTANLNALFAGQVDEYVGLDGLRAFPLPDGRVLWLAQDVFFSPSGIRLSSLSAARFAHNAALIQTGNCFRSIHGPSASTDRCPNTGTASYVGGALTNNCSRWFWPMGGSMASDGTLAVFYAVVGNARGEGADTGAAADGVWIARIDPTTLHVVSFLPAPADDGTLLYGWSVDTTGDYSYLFGHSYDQFNLPDRTSPAASQNFVARVPAGRFDLLPEYWDGAAWSTDRSAARPINGDGATLLGGGAPYAMQPRLIDGVWMSVTKVNEWFGWELAIDTAAEPQGPWTRVRTMSVPTKTLDGSTNNYMPHLLPWRSPLGNLVVTISHNAWRRDRVADASPTLYRPTFFEVEPPASMATPTLSPITEPLGFVASTPRRAFDSRSGAAAPAAGTRRVRLAGLVAPGTEVVAVDIVGVDPQANGFMTVFACDRPQPWASNLNFTAGFTQASFAIVEVSAADEICVYSSAAAHLVVDVFGSYVARDRGGGGGASSFTSTDRRRLLDTRSGGMPTVAGVPIRIRVDSVAPPGAPATGPPTAVAINIAATEPQAAGYVTAYPCDRPAPSTSNLNVAAGQTLSNFAQVAVSGNRELCIVSNIATHVVVDLVGSFSAAADGWWYRPVEPTRLADSRVGVGMPVGPMTRFVFGRPAPMANSRPSLAAVPDSARALVVTAVAVDPQADGWLTVAPCDDTTGYGTVAINAGAGRTTANLSVVSTPLTSGVDVCMFSMMAAHHLLDLSGWYE